ncbi:integrase [Methanogenium organophilum]|uniref:Integrase n=1 Tax=Methanogenium organophilum TaxID=2199 RepID=A0A9X9S4F0_METOG|nr:integrase [Methanogenium organophilum]WAI01341.1 integrase [Methanogenium organophilum]
MNTFENKIDRLTDAILENEGNITDKTKIQIDRAEIELAASNMPWNLNLRQIYRSFQNDFHEYLINVRNVAEKKARWYLGSLNRMPDIYTIQDFISAKFTENGIKAFRNFIHFLEDIKGYSQINDITPEKWLKPAKVKQSRPKITFINVSDIVEVFHYCPDNLKTFYKLLTYTGGRGEHIKNMIDTFEPDRIITSYEFPDVSYYPTSELRKGTKNTYFVFFPTSFIDELKEYKMPYNHIETVYSKVRHNNVNTKNIRKWHANMLFKEGTQESVVDYLQGRTPQSVVAKHYANLNMQAERCYHSILPKFNIA